MIWKCRTLYISLSEDKGEFCSKTHILENVLYISEGWSHTLCWILTCSGWLKGFGGRLDLSLLKAPSAMRPLQMCLSACFTTTKQDLQVIWGSSNQFPKRMKCLLLMIKIIVFVSNCFSAFTVGLDDSAEAGECTGLFSRLKAGWMQSENNVITWRWKQSKKKTAGEPFFFFLFHLTNEPVPACDDKLNKLFWHLLWELNSSSWF